jgi:hypothetical protein
MGLGRVELPTSRLSGAESERLDFRPRGDSPSNGPNARSLTAPKPARNFPEPRNLGVTRENGYDLPHRRAGIGARSPEQQQGPEEPVA